MDLIAKDDEGGGRYMKSGFYTPFTILRSESYCFGVILSWCSLSRSLEAKWG